MLVLAIAQQVFSQNRDRSIGDTIHANHYSIHLLEVNTSEKSIRAFTEVDIIPLVDQLNTIPLELMSLTVDSVFVDGQAASFTHTDDLLRIGLLIPAQTTDTLSVVVYYQGQPFHEAWGGFHFDGDYAFNLGVGFESIPHNLGKSWFPCIDNFTDRATYDVFVTVDENLKGIAGGMLVSIQNNGDGTHTWHWQLNHRIPTYLQSVMVGDYILYEDEYYGMEDTVPIQIYTKPSDTGKVAGSFVNLHQILDFFESHFGPYPFGRVGYTGTAIGAMEHATNIAYPHFAINGNTGYESLYTHELSHMWFGDEVTCSSAEEMWLNEGWARFCEIYYLKVLYDEQTFMNEMRAKHHEVLTKTHVTDHGYWALDSVPQLYTYGSTSYDKGGVVANTLRGYLGDSLFFDAMGAFLNHFAFQSVSSAQMRDFLTDYTGINMNGFFDAWVSTPGTPHFAIDSVKSSGSGSTYDIEMWFKQKYKGADFLANNNRLEVGFLDDNFNMHTDSIIFSGETGYSSKPLDFIPEAVFIDPYQKINDATMDQMKFFTSPQLYTFPYTYFDLDIKQLGDSALVRATHNWVAPDSLKQSVEGLRLSPNRFWTLEGLWPEDFNATGTFEYDNDEQLDGDLILSENDSVVVLYRAGAHDEWHYVSQERLGPWRVGFIFVENLQKGDYTLAVWDKQIVGGQDLSAEKQVMIFPNPSHGQLNFKFQKRGNYHVRLFDTKGVLLDSVQYRSKNNSYRWKEKLDYAGVVLVRVYENNQIIAAEKVLFTQ